MACTDKVSLESLEQILEKMRFYDVYDGYISNTNGKICFYLKPCLKGKDLITQTEIQNAIAKLKNAESK